MTPPEAGAVSLELERLRGSVDTGFATLNGRLDVALTRTTAVEADIASLRTDHEVRIRSLERMLWRASGGAAVVGAGVGVITQLILR